MALCVDMRKLEEEDGHGSVGIREIVALCVAADIIYTK